MNTKPITPAVHGLIDYAFSALQLAAPLALGLGKTITGTYAALGSGFLAVNAFTDTPMGLKPSLSFKTHQRADAGFLAGLALLACAPFIRKNKRGRAFHLAFLAAAAAHYLLTDYDDVRTEVTVE